MIIFHSMGCAYFISDIHLGAGSPQAEAAKTARLLSFLEHIEKHADRFYIVGDLFDYWFEYRHAWPRTNLEVLFKLHGLVQAGMEVHYFIGNHDLWMGDVLPGYIATATHRLPVSIKLNGLHLFVAHGDGLIARDLRIRVLNRLFKSRVNIFLYRLIHPDLGLPLMRWVAKRSRMRGENRYAREYREYARSKIAEGFDAVILGHTHRPIFERIDSAYYVNLGDWLSYFTFLEIAGAQVELKTWPANQTFQDAQPKLMQASQV